MRPDANKSPLTRKVTAMALMWLADRGFKPLAKEVPICQGWIADIAGMAVLTRTEAIELKLIERNRKAMYLKESDWEARYRELPSPISCLVEVKVSRADFLKDQSRKFGSGTPHAHLNYVAVPADLVLSLEVPLDWGLLVCHESKVILAQKPRLRMPETKDLVWLAWDLAVKLDHEKRYAAHREHQREEVDRMAESRTRNHIHQTAMMLESVILGNDRYAYLVEKCPEHAKRALKEAAENLRARLMTPGGIK